jgi:hypothetical protein
MWYIVIQCGTLWYMWYIVVHCGTLWYMWYIVIHVVHCGTLWYIVVHDSESGIFRERRQNWNYLGYLEISCCEGVYKIGYGVRGKTMDRNYTNLQPNRKSNVKTKVERNFGGEWIPYGEEKCCCKEMRERERDERERWAATVCYAALSRTVDGDRLYESRRFLFWQYVRFLAVGVGNSYE